MDEAITKYLKFETGKPESVVLAFDQPFENKGDHGLYYTYCIKPYIMGETKFSVNPRVHGEIQNLGVVKGDRIIIEKVKGSPNDYITISLPENHPVKQNVEPSGPPIDKGITNFEKQFNKPEEKLDIHELILRVEALEKIVAELRKNAMPF